MPGGTAMFNRVIVPLDGSHEAERSLDVAVTLANSNEGVVELVSVCEPAAEVEREWYLKSVADRLGCPTSIQVMLEGPPSERILSIARLTGPAVVCMATHGRRRLAEAVRGSVASEVIRGRPGPIVVQGPHANT